jgi:hypothetical protein
MASRCSRLYRWVSRWEVATICFALTGVAIFSLAARATGGQGAAGATPRVEIAPNIMVSNDGDVTHIEPHLATHPMDRKRIIGASIVNYEYGSRIASYASTDGGSSWTPSVLSLNDAGDPQVAIGKTGTAYFAGLGSLDDRIRTGLFVARSEDSGLTWGKPILIAHGQDHPQIVVDCTDGQFGGRVYIGSLHGSYQLGVSYSTDDGRSWSALKDFVNGGGRYGHNVMNLLVLSDGTLFVPFATWTRSVAGAAGPDTSAWDFVLSTDGAQTFTAPRRIRIDRTGNLRDLPPRATRQQFPEFGVDSRAGVRKDRIYMGFPMAVNGYARLFMQYSDDRGTTWSQPGLVDPAAPTNSEQFNQMVTVNKDGVVGVSWLDTRAADDGSLFDEYFAASIDGGVTFLPATRVSSVSVRPHAPGNLAVTASASAPAGGDVLYIALDRALGRLENAGDYMGLSADADGVFHALWPDTRTGTYRLYTSAIRVTRERGPAARPVGLVVRQLKASEVRILFDPVTTDTATGIITVPLRVQNLTSGPLYGPVTIRFDVNPNAGDRGRVDVANYPEILGANNGQTGPGAEFDLTSLIGSAGLIVPGATTGQFLLRIKPKTPTGGIGRLMTSVSAAVGGSPQ